MGSELFEIKGHLTGHHPGGWLLLLLLLRKGLLLLLLRSLARGLGRLAFLSSLLLEGWLYGLLHCLVALLDRPIGLDVHRFH